MKIAVLISAGRFPSGILQELKAHLPQHQLIHWKRGESSPATDIEVLLVLGEVAAADGPPDETGSHSNGSCWV